jgi:hypothetical protein
MNENYLWDRSGPPDPEIERLEHLLAPLAHGGRHVVAMPAPRPRPWRAMAAVAAVVLLALAIPRTPASRPGGVTGWEIARVDGSARLGSEDARKWMPLRSGEALRTASESELTLEDNQVGRLDLGPNSEMRAHGSRVELNRGRLHAFIWAPPRQFVVDTPSARAVDLGCEYTLDVDPAGDGLLRVAMGWVAFQFDGHESFIPAGARCVTKKRTGPGIPYYEDAPASLSDGVAAIERGDASALRRVLAAARPRDGLTLWHLLTRLPAQDRGAIYDRFAELIPLPAGVSRDGAIAHDRDTIDRLWDALDLENTGWWRGWERQWSK